MISAPNDFIRSFFSFDVFEKLALNLSVGDKKLLNPETGLNTVFTHNSYRNFVQINNASLVNVSTDKVALGSILDIDTSLEIKSPDFLSRAETIFRDAHISEKNVFYGLLSPEYISSLNPEY